MTFKGNYFLQRQKKSDRE